jgi:hypothetical protein
MGAFRVAVLCLVQSGCVYVGTGIRPVPLNGPARMTGPTTTVEVPDFSMSLRFDGFSAGGFALFGLVVPVLPVSQWKWLTGIGPEDLRLGIEIRLVPRTAEGKFAPGSLRVLEGDQTYQPSEIHLVGQDCRDRTTRSVDLSEILPVSEKMCLRVSSKTCDLRARRSRWSGTTCRRSTFVSSGTGAQVWQVLNSGRLPFSHACPPTLHPCVDRSPSCA